VKDEAHSDNAGIRGAAMLIGDQWTLLIIWSALQGTTRFDDFHGHVGAARNILSNRLAKLIRNGVMVRVPVHSTARRRVYRLTKRGEALRPAIEQLERWGRSAVKAGPASNEN